jgi:hypothetical protein
MVGTGFKRTKFKNNQVIINYSRRTNIKDFVILNVILRNVMHSVKSSTTSYYNFGTPKLHYLFTKQHQSNQIPPTLIRCKPSFDGLLL